MRYRVASDDSRRLVSLHSGRETRVPEGTAHAMRLDTGVTLCGVDAERLERFEWNFETASYLERCRACQVAATWPRPFAGPNYL